MSKLICDSGEAVYCGGVISSCTGPGRWFSFSKDIKIRIPDDIPTVMCRQCGSYYLGEESDALEAVLLSILKKAIPNEWKLPSSQLVGTKDENGLITHPALGLFSPPEWDGDSQFTKAMRNKDKT